MHDDNELFLLSTNGDDLSLVTVLCLRVRNATVHLASNLYPSTPSAFSFNSFRSWLERTVKKKGLNTNLPTLTAATALRQYRAM